MTRHQRRKAAKALALVRQRQEIVRKNLSQPMVAERSQGVSRCYDGSTFDRARGRGTVPMTRPRNGYRVLAKAPGPCSWNPNG